MGLFSGASNLFNGVRSLFGGQPQAAMPSPDKLFAGEPGPFADAASVAPGVNAPGFVVNTGKEPLFEGETDPPAPGLGHQYTFAALANVSTKTYSKRWDEAYRRSRQDAVAMRRDAFLMSLLFERKYPTAQMPWHLEPDDKKNPKQQAVADYLKSCLDTLPNITELRMMELEALWYGRAGVQMVWDWKVVQGKRSLVPVELIPVNGDKINFEWDGTPQIKIYGGAAKDLPAEDTVNTDAGLVLRLKRPYWRDRFIIHWAEIVDGDYFEFQDAGGRFGKGLRDCIYWYNWLKLEIASYLMEFLERTGLGFTVYYYDPGNPQDLANVKQIAKQQGRNTWIVWPRTPGDKDATKGVERIEPNVSGAQFIKDMLAYYDGYLERFIVGQSMSSGADNESGLGGSGRAQFARQTKQYIIRHDTLKLQGTESRDLVGPLIRNNRENCEAIYGRPLDFTVRMKFDIDVDDPKAKLEAGKILFDMGVHLKEDELRSVAGFEKPAEDDAIVGGQPAAPGAAPAAPGQEGKLFEGKPTNGQLQANGTANGTLEGKPNGKPKPEQEDKPHGPIRYAWREKAVKAGMDPDELDTLAAQLKARG